MPQALEKTSVPLQGGLDLVSPRYAVPPGTLQDVLNYETSPIAGYSVVEGVCRYDGTYPCFVKDWLIAKRDSGSGNFVPGQYLKNGADHFGIVIMWEANKGLLHYLIFDQKAAPKIGQTIVASSSPAVTLTTSTGGIKKASIFYPDELSFLSAQNAIYDIARNIKVPIYPYVSYAKNVIPHGLHWYKSRLYAIADNYQISFTNGKVEPKPGDSLGNQSRTAYGTVLSVNVASGSWVSSNAAGTIVVRPEVGIAFTNSMLTGPAYLVRPNGSTATTTTLALTITDLQTPNSPSAGLFAGPLDDDWLTKQQALANLNWTGKIWQPIDMGWEIDFATDNTTTGNAPARMFRGDFLSEAVTNVQSITSSPTTETLDSAGTLAAPLGQNSRTFPASTPLHTVLSDNSNTSFVALGPLLAGEGLTSAYAKLHGFTQLASIPDASIITGIELYVTARGASPAPLNANFKLDGDILNTALTTPAVKTIEGYIGPTTQFVLGSPTELWGAGALTSDNLLSALRDPTFGIRFNMATNLGGGGAVGIYELSIKVYYKQVVESYYAHDPATGQDLKIDVPYYRLLKGQFNPGANQNLYGSGSMAIHNIKPLSSTGGGGSANSSTLTIGSGWELRTARDGGGVLIAKFTSQMRAATLPPRATMEAAKKRFVIYTANYYANADWKAFYGASGCGPSFQYDGYYFYNVYTALPVSEDKPSHTVYHRNYAILGYDNGQCIVSVPGEPTNFSPIEGSTIYPFGDRIVGLLSLNGTALSVLCESSIHALTGDVLAASPANNAVSQVISPYSGAIEGTVIDCGIPLFADFRGISTIETTDRYGDFANGRVSFAITPLLTNRVNERFAFQASSQNIAFAFPVRSKNQARFVCEDGTIITCSLPNGSRGFEFTKQQYANYQTLDSLVPVAVCTGTSRSGRDLLFATFRIKPLDETTIATPQNPRRECYVYSLDKGTQFDDGAIRHFARLNFQTLGDPNNFDNVRKVRIEMLSNHYFDGYVSLTTDYDLPSVQKRPLKIDPTKKPVRIDKDGDYLVASTEGFGTTVAIEIGGEHKGPGHTLQALLIYSLPAREQLGNSPTQSEYIIRNPKA